MMKTKLDADYYVNKANDIWNKGDNLPLALTYFAIAAALGENVYSNMWLLSTDYVEKESLEYQELNWAYIQLRYNRCEELAAAGDMENARNLAGMLEWGEGGLVKLDKERALKILLDIAERGYAEAQYSLFDCYLWGARLTEPNREKALFWLGNAAANGHEDAQEELKYFEKYEEKPLVCQPGCSKIFAEKEDMFHFNRYILHVSPITIRIIGYLGNRFFGIDEIEIVKNDQSWQVLPSLKPVSEGVSGNLDYTLVVPKEVNSVTFGYSNTVIWARIPDKNPKSKKKQNTQ